MKKHLLYIKQSLETNKALFLDIILQLFMNKDI